VIALDFFAQFDPKDLLGCDAGGATAKRCSNKRVKARAGDGAGFLGRDEEFSAFSKWLNEEFEGELLALAPSFEKVLYLYSASKEVRYARNPSP